MKFIPIYAATLTKKSIQSLPGIVDLLLHYFATAYSVSTAEHLIVLNIKILYMLHYNLHCILSEDNPSLFVYV